MQWVNIVSIAYGKPTYKTCLESEEGKCVLGECLIAVDEDGRSRYDFDRLRITKRINILDFKVMSYSWIYCV